MNFTSDYNSEVIDPGFSEHKAVFISLTFSHLSTSGDVFAVRKVADKGLFILFRKMQDTDGKFVVDTKMSMNEKFNHFLPLITRCIENTFSEKRIENVLLFFSF